MEMARFEGLQDENASIVQQQLQQKLKELNNEKKQRKRYLQEINVLKNRLLLEERRSASIFAHSSNMMKAAAILEKKIDEVLPTLDASTQLITLTEQKSLLAMPTKRSVEFSDDLTPTRLVQAKQKLNVEEKLIKTGEFLLFMFWSHFYCDNIMICKHLY